MAVEGRETNRPADDSGAILQKCGLWVTTKEHQTRVQTFPIFPKGFQVLT